MKLETTFAMQGARSGKFWGALFLFILSPFIIGISGAAFRHGIVTGIAALVSSFAVMIGSGVTLSSSARGKRGLVTITSEGVDFGVTNVPRSQIASAAFTPAVGRRPPSVRLSGHGDRELAWIGVRDPSEGDALLAALALSPAQASARFAALVREGSAAYFWMVAIVVLAFALGITGSISFHAPALGMAMMVPILAAIVYFSKASIHIGADGLFHEMRVGSRFLPWSEVRTIEPLTKGIAIALTNGERYEIPTSKRGQWMHESELAALATLVARARSALAAFRGGVAPEASARVARLGRTKEAWLAEVRDRRRNVVRDGSFRQAPLRAEDLWQLVESPGAELTARAGAAAVLAQDANEDDRSRLRIAADTCVEPRLRVVFDRAASGEDPMEALGDLGDIEARGARDIG